MALPLLQAIALSRSFGQFQVVYPLDFEIFSGEIVILTGSNGAGKSTLLNCLSGLLRPTNGNILVEGFDLYQEEVEAKKRLAYVLDVPRFYQELTTWEHLQFVSLAFGVPSDWEERAESLLRGFGMLDSRNVYTHNLSRGMRLKLGICLALIRPFQVLLMDEPTSALDPESIHLLLETLVKMKNDGCGILLTSHNLSVLEVLNGKKWRMEGGHLETG